METARWNKTKKQTEDEDKQQRVCMERSKVGLKKKIPNGLGTTASPVMLLPKAVDELSS